MPTRELYLVSYSRGRILKIVPVTRRFRAMIPDPGPILPLHP